MFVVGNGPQEGGELELALQGRAGRRIAHLVITEQRANGGLADTSMSPTPLAPGYLREVIESQYPGGGNGQVGAPGAHQSGQGGPVPTAVVGHSLVLARQVGEGALHRLGDGEARVVDDVAQVGVGQQVVPFVDFVDGEQHGLGPAEGAEVKAEGWRRREGRGPQRSRCKRYKRAVEFLKSASSGKFMVSSSGCGSGEKAKFPTKNVSGCCSYDVMTSISHQGTVHSLSSYCCTLRCRSLFPEQEDQPKLIGPKGPDCVSISFIKKILNKIPTVSELVEIAFKV